MEEWDEATKKERSTVNRDEFYYKICINKDLLFEVHPFVKRSEK